MERTFLNFFKRRGHEILKRYPVVARWRDDIFLTIASIADFQPWVTSGQVPPPANPLVISQPSIRLKDIDNVGRSGRHFTLFFMGGHHAFNSRSRRIYWNDETVAFCHEFLTRALRIKPEEITYIQAFWEGGGNAGEDFEVNVRRLELATLVFMHYAGEGGKYWPLPLEIVDTGYGLERFVWLSHGTSTSYEPVFGPVIERVRELSGIEMPPEEILRENSRLAGVIDIESGRDLQVLRANVAKRVGMEIEDLNRMLAPLEAVYAIADHLRCLSFMFTDGITPSNVREGYLARLVLRRTLRLMEEIGVNVPLAELVCFSLETLKSQFREFEEKADYVLQVIEQEERKYRESIKRGTRLVERMTKELLAKHEPMPVESLIQLYDSHGLPPDLVKEVAEGIGVRVQVPEDFYIRVAKSHSKAKHVPVEISPVPTQELKRAPPTKALYYTNPYAREFKAKVLRVIGDYVVLNQTAFYPEGGGQPADVGILESKRVKARVKNVLKVGGVVLHHVEPSSFKQGQLVKGKLDWERRSSLMTHHTGTHILLGAMRRVLGNHIWQQGVQKGVERTRLDVSHFRRIELNELRKIERLANDIVRENRPVYTMWMDRNEAEQKYGFDLYQGGVVPGKRVRVVDIEGWNTQACAGTHYTKTGEVGFIKIIRTERIQDGIERIEFATGDAALKYVQGQEGQLWHAAGILKVPPEKVASATEQLFNEWKEMRKEIERLQRRAAEQQISELRSKVREVRNVHVLCEEVGGASPEELIKIGDFMTKEDSKLVAILGTRNDMAKVVVMAGDEAVNAGIDCGEMAAEASKIVGGGGGGKPNFGQGGGSKKELLTPALQWALDLCEIMIARKEEGQPAPSEGPKGP
jgi:alanyl-tRNA synthetase